MYNLKKILGIVCIFAMFFTMSSIVVSAEEGVGDTLAINNENSNFSELVCVENGKAYIPLRLMFPNLNDKENKIGMSIEWDAGIIRLIHGETSGEGYIKLDNGKAATPFVGNRKCVDIQWVGDPAEGTTAYLTLIEYKYNENGEREWLDYDDSQVLDNPIYLKKVEGGDRMFVAVEDISKISEWLKIDDSYKVKLYK